MLHASKLATILVVAGLTASPDLAYSQTGNIGQTAAARQILTGLDKSWQPYENKPNLGDVRWKALMTALVEVARLGPDALPALEDAEKEGSPFSESTRTFAAKAARLLRGPAALRDKISSYDLTTMDIAGIGKHAPDFVLRDASGNTHRLSQYRGKKIVVLTFVVADT